MIQELLQLTKGYKEHWLLMLLAGLIIRFIISARRFNRRGVGGLQHFNSYGWGLLIITAEFITNLVGLLFILIGLLYFLSGNK